MKGTKKGIMVAIWIEEASMVKIIKITVDTTHRWRAEHLQQVLIHVKTMEVSEADNINN